MASFSTSAERSSSVPKAPGAMTMAMRAAPSAEVRLPSSHLRLGWVEAGSLLREEILAPSTTLDGDVARLVEHRDGRWHLRLERGVRARIASPAGTAIDVSGEGQLVGLEDGARGRLVVGERTLLFQLVDAPTTRTRPQLPASVRSGILHQIDAAFTAVVMGSFLLHFGVITVLENADWPTAASVAVLPPDAIEMLIQPLEPEPVAPIETATDTDTPPDEVADANPVPTPDSPSTPSPSHPSRSDRPSPSSPEIDASLVAEAVMASVDQLLIGSVGPGGALHDVIAGGVVLDSAAEVMATADAVGVADGGPAILHDRTPGTRIGPPGDLGDLDHVAGHSSEMHGEGEAVAERRPVIDVPTGDDIEDDSGTGVFDSTVLARAIRGATTRIRRCYEHELNGDPTLRGRVEIAVTVEETGSMSHVRTTENTTGSDAVATCVTRAIGSLRVSPAPTGGSVSYRFPFVFDSAE